jgi:hypothetical protein
MKATVSRLTLLVLALGIISGPALSELLRVGTAGSGAEMVTRCPHCGIPIATAAVGDYQLGFSTVADESKRDEVSLKISVADHSGAPVNDAAVVVRLSMPGHRHQLKPKTAISAGSGRYVVRTGLAQMNGRWQADVSVTTSKGGTRSQVFTFYR